MLPRMESTRTRGKVIRDLRNQRGISQTELAIALGIRAQGTISAWENDRANIDPRNLLALIEYFGVEPDVLGYEMPSTTPGGEMPAWAASLHAKLDEILRRLHDLEHQR